MQLSQQEAANKLSDRLALVSIREEMQPEGTEASIDAVAAAARMKAGILAKFAEFLGDNLDLLPPKETVLNALDQAVDMAFTALGRPVIARLLKPAVKSVIREAASRMYDSIVDGLDPRTEV